MIDEREGVVAVEPAGDADTDGRLAMAMFIGVIVLMLVAISAMAVAA